MINKSSDRLFTLGIIITAVLIPLDLFTRGPQPIEIVALILLFQRPLLHFIKIAQTKKSSRAWRELFISGLPFGLPLLAAMLSAVAAIHKNLVPVYLLTYASLLIRGWIIARFAESSDIRMFEYVTLIMAGLVVLFGYFQFFGDVFGLSPVYTQIVDRYRAGYSFVFPRVHSTALEPLYFANYLFVPLGILLYRFMNSTKARVVELILFVGVLSSLFMTNARSAYISLFILILYVVIGARKSLSRLVKPAVAMLVAGVVAAAFIAVPFQLAKKQGKRTQKVSSFVAHASDLTDESAMTRYELWPKVFGALKHNFTDGVGINNARAFLHPYKYSHGTPIDDLQPFNNDYITLAAETGLLGLLAFVPIALAIIRILTRMFVTHYRPAYAAYGFAVLPMWIQMNSFGGIMLARTWVTVGLMFASYRIYLASQPQKRNASS